MAVSEYIVYKLDLFGVVFYCVPFLTYEFVDYVSYITAELMFLFNSSLPEYIYCI